MDNNNAEKRKHKRLRVRVPVRYRALKSGAGVEGAATLSRNISQGGIRFKAAEFISIATRLMLEMDLPVVSGSIRAISKIAWIRKTPAGDDFEVGSHFLEMSKKDKELVSEFVENVDKNGDSSSDVSGEDRQDS